MGNGRFEIRVAGSLSDRARAAFVGMDVVQAAGQTLITGTPDDTEQVPAVLALIQSMGLRVISLSQRPEETPAP